MFCYYSTTIKQGTITYGNISQLCCLQLAYYSLIKNKYAYVHTSTQHGTWV